MLSVLIPTKKTTKQIIKNKRLLRKDKRIGEWLISKKEGIGNARQDLLKRSKYNLLFWIDDDVELINNPIDDLIESMKKYNAVGVSAAWITEGDEWFLNVQKNIDKVKIETLPEICKISERFFQCGIYKKKPLLDVGGFGEKYKKTGEDNDVACKLFKKGYIILQNNRIIVKHHVNGKNFWKRQNEYREGLKKTKSIPASKVDITFTLIKKMPLKYPLFVLRRILTRWWT